MVLGKIEQVKLSEKVLKQLKEMIKNGEVVYGDKLPTENELAEIFGVSRTTVREALVVLGAEGWVETKRGGRTSVKRTHSFDPIVTLNALFGIEDVAVIAILEAMELRKILESEVVVLAASRATNDNIIALQQAHQKMVEDVAQGRETEKSDYEFHFLIAKASHNNTIVKVVSNLHDLYYKVIRTTRNHWSKPHDYVRILSEHEAILKSIEQRQGARAKKQMHNHLDRVQRQLEELLAGSTH